MSITHRTDRAQFLHYDLIRSGRFTSNELALLNIINSYSQRCELKQEELAKMVTKSVATVRRTINSLISKGIIDRTYTVFKRCVLRIRTLDQQKELMTLGGILKQVLNRRKKSMKSSDRSPMSEVNRSPMSEPTRSKTQEINSKANFQIGRAHV